VLNSNFAHPRFSDFFKNPELLNFDERDQNEPITCSLSVLLYRQDLPQFGDGEEYLENIEFKNDSLANSSIPKLVNQKE
jgi:hypothetical protein